MSKEDRDEMMAATMQLSDAEGPQAAFSCCITGSVQFAINYMDMNREQFLREAEVAWDSYFNRDELPH